MAVITPHLLILLRHSVLEQARCVSCSLQIPPLTSKSCTYPSFSNHLARHKLYLLSPGCIIIPEQDTLHSSKLSAVVFESFPAEVSGFHRRFFNADQGRGYFEKYSCVSNMLTSGLGEKYYCLSAICALIKYLESEQNLVFSAASILFKYQAIDGRVMVCSSQLIGSRSIRRPLETSSLSLRSPLGLEAAAQRYFLC
jgi:DNA mismatch repair ATPase MutS